MNDARLRSDQGLRIESLGDNCELGFVLRRLGHEAGSLFRWASIKPGQILEMLRAGLNDFYRFDDLIPFRTSMVCDVRYGVGWHSAMKSHLVDGRQEFVDDLALRRRIHLREHRKVRYLVSKFLSRAQLGGLIYVIKDNSGIDPAVLQEIFGCLLSLSAGAPFTLLEVQLSEDPALVGTVVRQRPGLLRGYVPAFAPYTAADDADYSCWSAILDRALAMEPCDDWTRRIDGLQVSFSDGGIQLPFPFDRSQDLTKPIMGDLRGGAVVLHNGNQWCRPVESVFRVHGPEPGQPGAKLHWTGVRAPGFYQLAAILQCPIEDSVTVNCVVAVRDGSNRMIAQQEIAVGPARSEEILLNLPANAGHPIDIQITANSERALSEGERAVVDLSPLILYPAI